ncbi:aldose epimerase family protein [Bacillus sp. FSL K6-3431]|uniref:aldose epimerase family protein n=1 Tax=Bacillus sp. FSL K6-3431 TaxID=2921500 RepID=UPI0030F66971
MYKVTQKDDGKYKVYELKDIETNSILKVAPERGGIITGFAVQGEEILFLNKQTFHDETANVRGGIPILFPISGQLENGEYKWEGKKYKMKNHGFARNLPWEVIDTNVDGHASMTIRLGSNDETKAAYPFDFEVIFTYVLKGNTLTIHQEYTNKSNAEMPMYAGFHPYFKSNEKNIAYDTDAKTYLDNDELEVKEVHHRIDLSNKKEAFVLLDARKKEIAFELRDLNKKVSMTYGEEFKYIYIWTEQNQDFICVEPWMAMTNEFNRKDELYIVDPKETVTTEMTISVV